MKQRSFSNRGLLDRPPDPVRLAGQRARYRARRCQSRPHHQHHVRQHRSRSPSCRRPRACCGRHQPQFRRQPRRGRHQYPR